MQFKTGGMRFTFEDKSYIANMRERELYGNDGIAYSEGYNIPIKLPDGRFIRADGWLASYPPHACSFVVVSGDGINNYATAELITQK